MRAKHPTISLGAAGLVAAAVFYGAMDRNHEPNPPATPRAAALEASSASPESLTPSIQPEKVPPPPLPNQLSRAATREQIFGTKPLADYIPGDRLTLTLSPDQVLDLVITVAGDPDPATGARSLAARIEGVPFGSVAVSTLGDALYASINGAALGNFEVRRVPGTGDLQVRRLLPTDDLRCTTDHVPVLGDTDADTASAFQLSSARSQAKALAGGTVLDVAVFFNDQARVILGGAPGNPADDADIRVKIATAITDANSAMVDSDVPTALRAVYVAPISFPYPPTEPLDHALNQLRSTTDGVIDQVHTLRDASQADIVSLWIANDVGGGKANLNLPSNVRFQNAFNVIRARNPTATFVHEVGHNHGCRHLRSSYTGTPISYFPDSFAHLLIAPSGSRYVTVVASNSDASSAGASRILRVSAPELSYLGTPTGIVNNANNAATFRAVGPLIANFRGGPDTTSPEVRLKTKSRVKTRRGRLTIRGRAVDDVSINRVVYKATGQRGLKTAKGALSWKLKVRLKKRRTVVKIFAFDSSNNRSNPAKVKIIRVRRK